MLETKRNLDQLQEFPVSLSYFRDLAICLKLWLIILKSLYCVAIAKSYEYQVRTVNVSTKALQLHRAVTQNKTEREALKRH